MDFLSGFVLLVTFSVSFFSGFVSFVKFRLQGFLAEEFKT